MSILTTIFGGTGGKIIDSLDGLFTSDEERDQKKNELTKILKEAEESVREAAHKHEQELTARHEADMKSDSWLSKNVRPGSLVFLLAVVSLLSVTDGNVALDPTCIKDVCVAATFTIGDHYVTLFENLLLLAFGFYFGSRGIEKIATLIRPQAPMLPKPKRKKPKAPIDDVWDDEDEL